MIRHAVNSALQEKARGDIQIIPTRGETTVSKRGQVRLDVT
jgi:hypothetical protein